MEKSEPNVPIKILGKHYELEFVDSLPGDTRGICDAPHVRNKKIRILDTLQGEELIEVLIHEMLHAGLWIIDEEIIHYLGKDLAKVIWKLLLENKIKLP